MTLFPGLEVFERSLRILSAVFLILLFFTTVCMASTPRVQPSLLFDIPNGQQVGNFLSLSL